MYSIRLQEKIKNWEAGNHTSHQGKIEVGGGFSGKVYNNKFVEDLLTAYDELWNENSSAVDKLLKLQQFVRTDSLEIKR